MIMAPVAITAWWVFLPWQLLKFVLRIGPRTPSALRVNTFPPVPGTAPARTLFFIHGWPDCGRLWQPQVAYFTNKGYTCVVVTLPNHDGTGGGWGVDFETVVQDLVGAVRKAAEGPGRVVLFCHDWGCMLGYLIASRHPDLVSHLVALDIGIKMPQTPSFTFFFASYQLFNLLTFLLGHPAGTWAQRSFLSMMRYRARPLTEVTPSMNYMYYHFWRRFLLSGGKPLGRIAKITTPLFFAYGTRKMEMFHSEEWLAQLQQSPANRVLRCENADHWVTLTSSPAINENVHEWLQRSAHC
eukprot:EG_transcript_18393